MSKWIAEGATVLEEGGEVDNVICSTEYADDPGLIGQEAPHRMAQLIADEHNELVILRKALAALVTVKWSVMDDYGNCPWCGYDITNDNIHKPNCPWLVAKQLLEGQP